MPPDSRSAPPRRGFGVPLDAWFRGELRDYVRDSAGAVRARIANLSCPQAYVRRTARRHHDARRANHGQRLWALLTFERWLQLLPSWRILAPRPYRSLRRARSAVT